MNFQFSEEDRAIQGLARDFAQRYLAPKAFTWEKSGLFPWENLRAMADHGFVGMNLPEAEGGGGRSLLHSVLVLEEIARVCPTSADVLHHTTFGGIHQLVAYGSPALKERVLPGLLRGEKLLLVGMTEPDAGSAVTDLATTARYEGDNVILNGVKVFNSDGPHGSYWVVWCRFGPGARGAGLVLVEKGTPGFHLGTTERFMFGGAWCTLYFDNAVVPRENVLLDQDGFRKMLHIFNIERIGNATRSLALGQLAFDRAVSYAQERRQFGRPLCEFQGLQWKFADMKMKLDAARLLIYRAAANASDHPHGAPDGQECAIAKGYANQVGFEVCNEALQIFGGYGYVADAPANYLFRRSRGWMIAGGSQEMMRNTIAAGIFGRKFSQRP